MDKHLTIGNDGLLRGQLLALDRAHRVKLWLLGLGSLNRLLAVHTLKRLLCRFSAAGFDVIEGDRRVEAVDAASIVDFLKVLGVYAVNLKSLNLIDTSFVSNGIAPASAYNIKSSFGYNVRGFASSASCLSLSDVTVLCE